ncbi:MAG: PorT family protein [Bacteroidetes bacterium]|nr:MAG: PorT family protein [Bacteroidota bacterium]
MKKIVVLSLLFSLGSLWAVGLRAQGELRFGFQVSPVFSWMSTDDRLVNGNGSNLGLKLGVLGEYYFRPNYAIMSGIGFAFNHGGTLFYENGGEIWTRADLPSELPNRNLPPGVNLEYNVQYIEIPLALRLRSNEFGYYRIYVDAPVFTLNFKTQARGSIQGSGIDEEKIDIRKEVNGLALSWGLGVGMVYEASASLQLTGGVAYQRFFTDIVKDSDADDSKNVINSLTLRFGIVF